MMKDMELTKDTYRKMNKAYNTIFDEWQNIQDMPPGLYSQLNTALVLLDGVLDELKKKAVEAPAAPERPSTAGFTVLGGR